MTADMGSSELLEWLKIFGQVGFPSIVALFLLYRLEPAMLHLSRAVRGLREVMIIQLMHSGMPKEKVLELLDIAQGTGPKMKYPRGYNDG